MSMHIEELKIDGDAFITSIDPCPVIAGGEGSVVTARFMTRQVDELATVTILGPDGQTETLTGTTIHPIWSVDRQDWVELAELQEGETLQAVNGLATVLSVNVLHQSTPVYNFEVHGEHVYQVGELAVLVHNECAYQAVDTAGNVIYVGITNNFLRRKAEHAVRFTIDKIRDGLSRADARAIEQFLINKHQLAKNGGTLLNKINSISTKNPKYQTVSIIAKANGF
jgi:hypothetical protein